MADFKKDPDAVLDYIFDWRAKTNNRDTSRNATDYLNAGEVITVHTVAVSPAGALAIDSSELSDGDTAVLVWLSGGVAGVTYDVTCHIETSLSRTDDRTAAVQVVEK